MLGLNHEQQHQELMLTDIKHVFWMNPLRPCFDAEKVPGTTSAAACEWRTCEGGLYFVGHEGTGFCFDNERPRHQVFLNPFSLGTRLVTNQEYLEFMEDNGYGRPELWLSLGWTAVNERGWNAPLYWEQQDGRWWMMTLAGMRPVRWSEPVCHISYFEADAYARWAGARLPTEAEWEVAPARRRRRAILPRAGISIQRPPRAPRTPCNRCSARCGSGPKTPTRLIRATGPQRAPWANTTENSCATSTLARGVLCDPPLACAPDLSQFLSARRPVAIHGAAFGKGPLMNGGGVAERDRREAGPGHGELPPRRDGWDFRAPKKPCLVNTFTTRKARVSSS